jgi:hypothetical protein
MWRSTSASKGAAAVGADVEFDLADTLGLLIRNGAIATIAAVTTEGAQHEPDHRRRDVRPQAVVAAGRASHRP